jgi:hypothetical protein
MWEDPTRCYSCGHLLVADPSDTKSKNKPALFHKKRSSCPYCLGVTTRNGFFFLKATGAAKHIIVLAIVLLTMTFGGGLYSVDIANTQIEDCNADKETSCLGVMIFNSGVLNVLIHEPVEVAIHEKSPSRYVDMKLMMRPALDESYFPKAAEPRNLFLQIDEMKQQLQSCLTIGQCEMNDTPSRIFWFSSKDLTCELKLSYKGFFRTKSTEVELRDTDCRTLLDQLLETETGPKTALTPAVSKP